MVDEFQKKDCCGCYVCANICPKNCIEMVADHEGFSYPKIDHTKCIKCNLCEKHCPVKTHDKYKTSYQPTSFVVQANNNRILRESTSGGSFTLIAKAVLDQDGEVWGAAFNKEMEVFHKCIRKVEELKEFRGSKYVQSIVYDAYKNIKSSLKSGKLVCFSGTPCQVAGLKSFLGWDKEYKNLLTVDIVCHGVPSPKLWKKYKQYNESRTGSRIVNASFRNKKYGYLRSSMQLDFQNGSSVNHFTMDDYFLSAFFAEICSRPSCHHCAFKYVNRNCDFTIFDCWNVSVFTSKIKAGGATNVFIHTKKGCALFDKIKSGFNYSPTLYSKAIQMDGSMMTRSTIPNHNRHAFFMDIDKLDIAQLKQKYYPNNFSTIVKSKLRLLLIRGKLFNLIFNHD